MVLLNPVRILVAAGLATGSAIALAPGAAAQFTPAYSGRFGIEGHYQKYREGSLDVTEQGWFGGITGEVQVDYRSWQFRADARFAHGRMDYSGSGTVDGIDDYVFEGRLTFGRELVIGASGRSRITPYLGYGYRRLYDDLGGRVSSSGALGYDRLSQYHYLPLGVEGLFYLGDRLSIRPTIEYDRLIHGTQDSYLSDTGLFDDVHNNQESGYGVRASLMLGTLLGSWRTEFGPFFRYWNIEQSDTAPLTIAGVVVGSGWEPANETWEAGMALRFRF